MKSIFNNQVVQKKNKDTKSDQETSPNSVAATPAYYHHPSSTSTTSDSYSHTASSTAGYAQTNAYPTLATHHPAHEKQSLFGKIETTATNLLGSVVGEDTVVSAANKLNSAVTSGRNARELLQTGAIVQLVSRSSGHLLQALMSPNGVLVFDGNGPNNSFNTYFTVEEGEKGRFRFHNSYNYLAFEGKQACIMSLPPGAKNNPSIDFRVHDILGSSDLVAFESCACKNYYISITTDGHLKTANLKDKNLDAQFSVVLITNNQQPMYPYQTHPYQQFNMNPYGGLPPNGASGYTLPQPPTFHQQPPAAAPPPSYSTQNPYSQPSSTSSGLYPKFN